MLWTVSKGIRKADVVLCPDGTGTYRVGEVLGEYYYVPGEVLPHRRKVRWLDTTIDRTAMSESLRHSSGSPGTVANISKHRDEIEALLGQAGTIAKTVVVSGDEEIEDPIAFAMEQHLEEFLVAN